MNLTELFAIPRRRTPNKVAVRFRDGDRSRALTYQQLHLSAERLAAALQRWGLRKGDRVAFFLGNGPEFLIAYLAVIRLGAIMTPINLRYRRLEIGHILSDCQPRLLITEEAKLPLLADVDTVALGVEETILAETLRDWQADPAGLNPPVVQGDDLAMLMYTSGTTGQSKGAMLTHNNVLATVTGLLAAWAWEQEDRLLLCLPLFHVHGLIVGAHCALAAGATILLHTRFDAAEIIADLTNGQPTAFFAVPTIYVRLIDDLEKMPTQDLSHMRIFCSGSAPLAAETHAAFRKLTDQTILERYGMTETGMNLSNPYAGPRVAGSVGTPLPGVSMRIVDERGQDVAAGEEGEIWLMGSNVFGGYWNAPQKTAESFSHDDAGRQWFHTGDLARQDPATGYITLLGRRHELIISGGFNIYPREIEELLVTYPGVAEAAVVGATDPKWGEVVVAYLVCAEEVNDDALVTWCREHLASFKTPRQIHHVDELPRNAMGKLQKHLLKNG